jgi:ACS family 4-hydroxyphenylacetate permease-like MFS transporter
VIRDRRQEAGDDDMIEMATAGAPVSEQDVMWKVRRRLMWFLFALFMATYIDRINIGFAQLTMNAALGLTATMYGFANTIFYLGYVACEIPSNLLLARFGARVWLSRIMITIGITSAATILAAGPYSLYFVRLLVGIAEAGFVPGVLLYLTYWFPQAYRARANAWLMIAMPATIAVASPLSGLALDMNGALGLTGWRWLFLLEAIPSMVLGVAAYFYLTDRPANASWLSVAEREWLRERMEREHASAKARQSIWSELWSPDVLLLTLAYFCIVTTLNTNATWAPRIIREVFANTTALTDIGLLVAIAPFCTLIAMPLWSARSDRRQERRWHTVCPMALAALGWLLITVGEIGWLRIVGLVFVSVGAFTAMAVFWALATPMLSSKARPASIALINSGGVLGSALSPLIVGYLLDLTGSFATPLWYATALLLTGIGVLLAVGKPAATRGRQGTESLTQRAAHRRRARPSPIRLPDEVSSTSMRR